MQSTTRNFAIIAAAAAVAVAGGYSAYRLGEMRAMPGAGREMAQQGAALKPGDVDPATGRKILFWHDPMVPSARFEAPGKSPFMNMQLVPVYEGAAGDDVGVAVDPRVRQSLGIRTAEVARATLAPRVEAVGEVAFNERDQAVVQMRATGFLEKLHVRAAFDRVSAGQSLADVYVPAWNAVQEEFLAVRKMRGQDLAALVDAARQRMRQAGMTDEQIRGVEERGALEPRITLRAPIAGVIAELDAREGMTVMPGDTLFRINALATVWVNVEVPESQAALLTPSAPVEARSPALPGAVFAGTVQSILPRVATDTRTVGVRVELANKDGKLLPGMFASVALAGTATESLVVPSEAVIHTGRRTLVMLATAGGTFRPVEVETGIESDGRTAILAGLTAGQSVVASGQFLLDSEASLRATSTRMEAMPATVPNELTEHVGVGKIEALATDSVTLSHGPIPSAQWGAMTMQFELPPSVAPPGLAVGERVDFAFTLGGDGKPRIARIAPAAKSAQ
jgi:Cu(I)/Ag(I) efflux system membrane fusion protein